MIHFKTLNPFYYLLIILSLAACSSGPQLPYRMDNGKIEDDFEIILTDKKITLKPNVMFSLPEKGLQASQKNWRWNLQDTEVQYAELKKNKYPSYDITIAKKGYKIYFGKILFFNLSSADKNKSLMGTFYKIKIDSRFFEDAKDAQKKCITDASRPTGKKASKKSIKPTWIIWISDSPF